MRVFVINLARRPDRLNHMRSQLADFDRIEAIDGMVLQRKGLVREFRFWCAKGYKARLGEIGCALSHQLVYQQMVAENIPIACVLEDDEILLDSFAEECTRAAYEISRLDEPCVITFSYTGAGYVLNKAAAGVLLSVNSPICSTADDWWRWKRRGGIRWICRKGCLKLSPYGDPMAQGTARSDIIGDAQHLVSRMTWTRRLCHKCLRIVGRTLDAILP